MHLKTQKLSAENSYFLVVFDILCDLGRRICIEHAYLGSNV